MNEVQRLKVQLNIVSESDQTQSNLAESVENLQSNGIKAIEAYNSLSLELEQSKDQNSWRDDFDFYGGKETCQKGLNFGRVGGGFRNYGSNGSYERSNTYLNGDDSSNSKWGSSRVFDENKRKKDEGNSGGGGGGSRPKLNLCSHVRCR